MSLEDVPIVEGQAPQFLKWEELSKEDQDFWIETYFKWKLCDEIVSEDPSLKPIAAHYLLSDTPRNTDER